MHSYDAIRGYLESNLNDYLELLRQIVAINSFTSNPQGVNGLARLTADAFQTLDFKAEFVPSTRMEYGSHLFLTRVPPGGAPYRAVAMISHLDTVFPPEEEIANDFAWRVEGERIYGPGTVDIKGGTVMIYMVLDALRTFAPQVYEQTAWYVCLDASEEALADDFGRLCLERLPSDTAACLVFEGGTIVPGVYPLVTARKGRATYRVTVEGKSAHAGNYHANGANAIVQMAHTVQKIAALTNYQDQITFNVGTITGGSVVNRVPHQATASVEMRAFSPQVFAAGVSSMLALSGTSEIKSKDGFQCKVHVELGEQTAPWPVNDGSERLYNLWSTAAGELGMQVRREERGGLSDGNALWSRFPTLDGLGPAGENAHCSERSADRSKDQEFVLASSFVPKALLNTAALLRLLTDPEPGEEPGR